MWRNGGRRLLAWRKTWRKSKRRRRGVSWYLRWRRGCIWRRFAVRACGAPARHACETSGGRLAAIGSVTVVTATSYESKWRRKAVEKQREYRRQAIGVGINAL
jgi:hypothetical protein